MKKWFIILALLFICNVGLGANKVYIARESAIAFQDTAGDVALTLNNLGDNEARISAQKDLGAGSTADTYEIRAVIEWDVAPDAGETADIYIATSNNVDSDGQGGTSDAAFTLVNLVNTNFVGSVVAHTAAADTQFTASFITRISTRYFSIIVHNKAQTAGDNLQATNDTSWVIVTPIPPEIQ
jgi:hypothetical protein